MKSNLMVKTAKIIAEVRTRTCIDKIDIEVIENILKDEKIQKGLKQNLFTIDEDTKYINYNIYRFIFAE